MARDIVRVPGDDPMPTLLAFDTSTERLTVALTHRGVLHERGGEAGAKASSTLLPAIVSVLEAAGIAIADLDAIAFGRGPGAFTGLRASCSVAQGLAFGAGKRVLPIDNLLAIAEDARPRAPAAPPFRTWVVVDARMQQLYAAAYAHDGSAWTTTCAPMLTDAAALADRWRGAPPSAVVGDAAAAVVAASGLPVGFVAPEAHASARALIELAILAWRAGAAVEPAQALPFYVRDKVAETIEERAAARAAKAALAATSAPPPKVTS